MKPDRIYQNFLLVILLFATTMADAEIYQWQDQAGNTIFSNTPPPKGEQSTIVSSGTWNVMTESPKQTAASSKGKNQIKDLNPVITHKKLNPPPTTLAIKITSPENNTHIHTFTPLIPLTTLPSLSPQAKVTVIANDKAANAVYQNNTWNTPRPPPGENKISLQGTTASGETFFSDTITIYIHNSHVRRR